MPGTSHADELGPSIAARRKLLGLTQEELAALAGVSTRFLSSLESGKPTARLSTVLAVLDALGLEVTIAPRRTA
jgi:HTH-type transcriptional regulator/antitoxin HipB